MPAAKKQSTDDPSNQTIPLHIKQVVRQRLGLEQNDQSRDADIDAMEPIRLLRHVCGWKLGDSYWAETFLGWARDCGYKIKP
jgi:hypothetical protein